MRFLDRYGPYVEDTLLGLAYLLIAGFTFFRTLTFIHLKGKGNYVIKAFHFVICITALLRCAWFWRSPNTYIYLLNSGSVETSGEFLSQTLNTLGTISLYSTFLILACYWSYMLEHVVLKTHVEPWCFVPAHLLPLEYSSLSSSPSPSPSPNWLATLGRRYCCYYCCRTTVIEVYLLLMKTLLCVGLAILAAFLSDKIAQGDMERAQAVVESLASAACMVTLTVLSRRIRTLLQSHGVQSQPAIEQHVSRIITVTVGVNAFLAFRVLLLAGYIAVTNASQSEWALRLCADKRSLGVFVAMRYGSEVAVLCVELVVSRILQKKQPPQLHGAGAGAGGGAGAGAGAGAGSGTGSGAVRTIRSGSVMSSVQTEDIDVEASSSARLWNGPGALGHLGLGLGPMLGGGKMRLGRVPQAKAQGRGKGGAGNAATELTPLVLHATGAGAGAGTELGVLAARAALSGGGLSLASGSSPVKSPTPATRP